MNNFNIVFIGTSLFTIPSLNILFNNFNISAVLTSISINLKNKKKNSFLLKFFVKKKILIFQPKNFFNINLIKKLKKINTDINIIVAFKILPKLIWSMPKLGTINLHPSLLPFYRGAAPINWSIINGEKKTGITTFFLNNLIDFGFILLQEKEIIKIKDNFNLLQNRLMIKGAKLILKTVEKIRNKKINLKKQFYLNKFFFKKAPKIFKNLCIIDWNSNINYIYNFIRGLYFYSFSYSIINDKYYKILLVKKNYNNYNSLFVNSILSDGKNYLYIIVKGGIIHIDVLQISGKKSISIKKFFLGNNI